MSLPGSLERQAKPAGALPSFRLYDIWTAHDSTLLVDQSSGTLFHGPQDPARAHRALACIPDARPDVCFVVADAATAPALVLAHDAEQEAVVSLRVLPREDGLVAFAHPVTGLFLCAEIYSGRVSVDRPQPSLWELFRLELVEKTAAEASPVLRRLIAYLPALASAGAALDMLVNASPAGEIRPVLRLLRADEIDWLGRLLRRNPEACHALSRIYPRDIWARHALPTLAVLPPTTLGQPGFMRHIGSAMDALSIPNDQVRCESFPQLCNIHARRDREPTRTVCLLATARNEGTYLLEWVAYHRTIGVEAFFIYTNDNDDGSDDLLEALAAAGVINWTTNKTGPGASPQTKAYGHALQIMPELVDFRWVGITDIDEFVVVNRDRYASLPTFLTIRELEPTDAVVLNWMPFGSHGQTTREAQPVIQRFTSCNEPVNRHVKIFFRPARFMHAGAHNPYEDGRTQTVFRSASGAVHPKSPYSPVPEDHHAWVAHYWSKSAEEYILRRSMSKGDMVVLRELSGSLFPHNVAHAFVHHHQRGGQPDDRVARALPDLLAEMTVLRGLPGVSQAERTIEQKYRERVAALADAVAADPRFQVKGSLEHWFMDVLQMGKQAGPSPVV